MRMLHKLCIIRVELMSGLSSQTAVATPPARISPLHANPIHQISHIQTQNLTLMVYTIGIDKKGTTSPEVPLCKALF